MNNKVYIRTDGGANIGLGHLVRCMALAYMLKDDFEIIFVCKEVPESIVNEFMLSGFLFEKISSETDFFNLINDKDLVVLDHYGLDTNYQKKIKEIGSTLVCIDDLHDKEFYADLIINHTPGIKASDYKAQIYSQFALGLEYALLRPAFLKQAGKKKKIEKIETVFICFGGSDFNNLTEIALKVSLEFSEIKKIIVVTGIAFAFNNEIQLITENNSKIEWFTDISEEKMLSLMMISDLAIVPSSGILLEVLSVGCVVISGMYIENQKHAFNAFKTQKNIISANTFSEVAIRKAVFLALYSSFNQITSIDGNQKMRFLEKIKSL